MVTQTINNRLLRLHRPFMSRGYRESKYRYSTKCAIFAARTCLITQQSLDRGEHLVHTTKLSTDVHLSAAPLLKLGFQLLNVSSPSSSHLLLLTPPSYTGTRSCRCTLL